MVKKMLMILMLVLVAGNCTRTVTGPTEIIVCTVHEHHHHHNHRGLPRWDNNHKDKNHGKFETDSHKSTHTTCEPQVERTATARNNGEVL